MHDNITIVQIMMNSSFGGAEKIFVDTSNILSKSGFSVHAIITPDFSGKHLLEASSTLVIHDLQCISRHDIFAQYKLFKLLLKIKPDLIHAHLRKSITLSLLPKRLTGIPLVSTMHNYGNIKTYSKCDYLIALTQDQLDYFCYNSSSVTPVKVIPNFSLFTPKASTISTQGPLRLLAYGRMEYKKGFDLLIQAVQLCLDNDINVQLTLVGNGSRKQELSNMIAANTPLNESVDILDWSNNIPALLQANDIFVLPSRSEPFGIVVIEAMSQGKAIISTLTEGPYQILSANNSLLCEVDSETSLYESIKALNDDRDLAQSISDQALLEYKTKYFYPNVLPQLTEYYQQIIDSK